MPVPTDRKDWEGLKVLDLLESLLTENRLLTENMAATHARSSELIQKARAWRMRLIELGDPDPGAP